MTPKEIEAIRKDLGVTQERFANLLGSSFATINRWENGKTKPSNIYIRELKELRDNRENFLCRRKKHEDS